MASRGHSMSLTEEEVFVVCVIVGKKTKRNSARFRTKGAGF
jgi:hypothetical protein